MVEPHELPSVGCRAVRVLRLALLASLVGSPTPKRLETATAHTAERLVAIVKNSIMLKIRVILIILLIGQLGLNAQTFNVCIDTLFLDVKDIARPASRIKLTHVVKFDNNYYCFFEEQGLYGFRLKNKHFLVVSDTGEILKNIVVPKEIQHKKITYKPFFTSNLEFFIPELEGDNKFLTDIEGKVNGFSINNQITLNKVE